MKNNRGKVWTQPVTLTGLQGAWVHVPARGARWRMQKSGPNRGASRPDERGGWTWWTGWAEIRVCSLSLSAGQHLDNQDEMFKKSDPVFSRATKASPRPATGHHPSPYLVPIDGGRVDIIDEPGRDQPDRGHPSLGNRGLQRGVRPARPQRRAVGAPLAPAEDDTVVVPCSGRRGQLQLRGGIARRNPCCWSPQDFRWLCCS